MGVRQYAGSDAEHVVYVLDGLDAPGVNYFLQCACGWSGLVASLNVAVADEAARVHVETPYKCDGCGALTADPDARCGRCKDRDLQALSDESSGQSGDLTDDEAGAWADYLDRVADDYQRGLS